MTELEIMNAIANHPRVVQLRGVQARMHHRFVTDYGNEFMGTDDEVFERDNGFEGVNRWTQPEMGEWYKITTRLATIRRALRQHYSQTV